MASCPPPSRGRGAATAAEEAVASRGRAPFPFPRPRSSRSSLSRPPQFWTRGRPSSSFMAAPGLFDRGLVSSREVAARGPWTRRRHSRCLEMAFLPSGDARRKSRERARRRRTTTTKPCVSAGGLRGTGDDGRPLGPLARQAGEAEALAKARQLSPTSVPGPAAPTRGNSRCHCCRWVCGLLSRLFVVSKTTCSRGG